MIQQLCRMGVVLALAIGAASVIGEDLKDTPLPLEQTRAFPNIRLNRPIVFTHPGDGTNRLIVASQLGAIHVMENRQNLEQDDVKLFLDLEPRVVYKDMENEEGLLGLAFHPRYKETGEFFVYYTSKKAPPHTSVVSRFRVSKDNPNQADATFEEELLRIPQPYWNHNGGGLAFGPDGFLYIALGDGGKRDDPHGHGQNTQTWLGSMLRIDVDHKANGKNYSIPKDNPFVDGKQGKPEIWAYGFRNIWGMAFDPVTGTHWAADVGQDIWEEIDIVVRGGNYGWNLREAKHQFKPGGEARAELIEPVWEYHHDIGKSITGGVVYRGKKFPELAGCFLYADYVSGKLWGLKYDLEKKAVVANYSLADKKMPIIAFGTDPQGEAYLTDAFGQIWTIGRTKE